MQQFNQLTTIMGIHTGDKNLVKTTEPRSFHFDLPKNVYKNLMYETDSIIKHNELLAEHTIKS